LKIKSRKWFAIEGLHPAGFLILSFFGFFILEGIGPCGTPRPSFPPLVTVVLITLQGAESPDSGRIGVIDALVYFFPSETVFYSP